MRNKAANVWRAWRGKEYWSLSKAIKGRVKQAVSYVGDFESHITELARAREVWRRKFEQPPQDASERARQSRFLAARGFGGEVIRKVLAKGRDADGGD